MSCGTARQAQQITNIYSSNNRVNNGKLYRSIAQVTTIPAGDNKGQWGATAWAYDENHLITAGHFCESAIEQATLGKSKKRVQLWGSNRFGQKVKLRTAAILSHVLEGFQDVCILKAKQHFLIPLIINTDMSILETEDPITVVGAPKFYYPVRREGFLWIVRDDSLGLGIEQQPGNSGSPVIWYDRVIGVVIRLVPGLHEGSIAMRSDDVQKFIDNHIKEK